ncbi:MAG: hypothetical protein L6Q71_02195 [Planctomycetes bacterium]|nr:hypothetical protein [Planctomycetota bacterium]NUQ33973.1 hypothetical protein [Planctomycetaceae bacterium]
MITRIAIGVVAILIGIFMVALLFNIASSPRGGEEPFRARDVIFNAKRIRSDGQPPGPFVPEMEVEFQDENGQPLQSPPDIAPLPPQDTPPPAPPAEVPDEVEMGQLEMSNSEGVYHRFLLYRLKHGPLFEISLKIDSDTSGMTEEEKRRAAEAGIIYDDSSLNLKREWYSAERAPLPDADPKKGPFYEPFQMETPRIAFDDLCRDVGAADPKAIADASNGEAWMYSDYTDIVPGYRGRVFDVAQARLWMLREQPLRTSVTVDGKPVENAWYGVAVFLRKGARLEDQWINQAVAFTTLSLPDELKPYALKPGEHPSNDDKLSRENVCVSFSGAWFRRIMYREPLSGANLALENADDIEAALFTRSEYWTEAYMPWLVCQGVERAQPKELSLDQRFEIVSQFDELHPHVTQKTDLFDEAGYYLLLHHTMTPGAGPLNGIVGPTEMTLRRLKDLSHRSTYRGTRMKTSGTLQSEYSLLMLPPNISGKRNVYRTYVLDALTRAEESSDLQWYADVVEPPLDLRGKARVIVDGYYYRSQIFEGRNNETGKTGSFVFPLLIAPKLAPYDDAAGSGTSGMNWTLIWAVGGVVAGIIVLLIVLGRVDRNSRERFERETLATVRGKLAKTRERLARKRAAKPGADAPPAEGGEGGTP